MARVRGRRRRRRSAPRWRPPCSPRAATSCCSARAGRSTRSSSSCPTARRSTVARAAADRSRAASTGRPTGCCWPSRRIRRRARRAGCRRCAGRADGRRRAAERHRPRRARRAAGRRRRRPAGRQLVPGRAGGAPVACASATPCASRCPAGPAGEGLAALLGDHADVTVGGAFELEAWRKLCANAVSGVMALAGRPAEIFALDDVREVARALAHECAAVAARRGRRAHRPRRRRRHRVARGAAQGRRLLDPHRPPGRPRARMGGAQRRHRPPRPPPRRADPGVRHGLGAPARGERRRVDRVRPPRVRTYVRALGQPHDRSPGGHRAARLPRAAVVRHFDAPEALDTRFYEVRAKSALNRVPERSRMPFRWTINPYRGCSHACLYCLGPDTPILMADGRTRLLAHLSPGDRDRRHRGARAISPLRHARRCSRTGRRSSRRIG